MADWETYSLFITTWHGYYVKYLGISPILNKTTDESIERTQKIVGSRKEENEEFNICDRQETSPKLLPKCRGNFLSFKIRRQICWMVAAELKLPRIRSIGWMVLNKRYTRINRIYTQPRTFTQTIFLILDDFYTTALEFLLLECKKSKKKIRG